MFKKIFSGKRVLVLLDRFGLGALFILVGVAFIAAVLEALPHGPANLMGIGSAVIDTITSDAKDAKGPAKLMHVLLTGALGWAAVQVYMATAGYRWDSFAARHLVGQHVVIMSGRSAESKATQSNLMGSGTVEKMADQSALAIDIALTLAPDHSVVLSIPGLQSSRLAKLWEAGVRVIKDDMELSDLLQSAGVKRAKMLIAMRDAYTENIVLTHAALAQSTVESEGLIKRQFHLAQDHLYQLIARIDLKIAQYILSIIESKKFELECKCMIEPLAVKQNFKLEDYLEDDSLSRVRVFNESELIARRIVRDYPPDALVAESDKRVHVLLVGFGSVGQSIVIQLARMGHYRSGLKPKITIVDKLVNQGWQHTLNMHPALPDWVTVDRIESRIEDVSEANAEEWLQDECPITMVYVCTKDEIANLKIARLLLRLLERETAEHLSGVQVVALDPPGGCVLEEFAKRGDNKNRIKLFSLTRAEKKRIRSPLAANLLTETDDDYAKALHKYYYEMETESLTKDPNHKSTPSYKLWGQLAETYRESSRSSTDHLEVKLRAVGRILISKDELNGAVVEAPLSEEEIKLLARIEHNRWWSERALGGWKYANVRKDELKMHPNMLCYDDLSEEAKKKDYDNVTAIFKIANKNNVIVMKSESSRAT